MLKLTLKTDPKTLAFEGHPDVKIVAIGDAPDYLYGKNHLFIYCDKNPHFEGWSGGTIQAKANGYKITDNKHFSSATYTVDGRHRAMYDGTWPKLILRQPVIDITQPLLVATKPVTLIEATPRHIIVEHSVSDKWMVFDYDGKRLDWPGHELKLHNPKIEIFHALVTKVDGQVTDITLVDA